MLMTKKQFFWLIGIVAIIFLTLLYQKFGAACTSWTWRIIIVAGSILLIVFSVNLLCERLRARWGTRFVVLLLTSGSLFVLFSVRPMRLDISPGDKTEEVFDRQKYTTESKATDAFELIKAEHLKAVDEIKLRIEQEDTWFHYKFVLVGGLLALLLSRLVLAGGERSMDERLEELFESAATCSVLALATIVALAIDIHIRNNIMVVQQLGLWIANYVEPALLHKPVNLDSAAGFVPWEQFLRTQALGHEAMHRDDLYGFIFYPHLHYLTWIIYISYLGLFQKFGLSYARNLEKGKNNQETPSQETGRWLAIAGFVLVHITIGAFTSIAHFAPSAFTFKIYPFGGEMWKGGLAGAAYFLIPWVFLSLLNLPYLYFLLFPHADIELRRKVVLRKKPTHSIEKAETS
jgi:hypothetical protein